MCCDAPPSHIMHLYYTPKRMHDRHMCIASARCWLAVLPRRRKAGPKFALVIPCVGPILGSASPSLAHRARHVSPETRHILACSHVPTLVSGPSFCILLCLCFTCATFFHAHARTHSSLAASSNARAKLAKRASKIHVARCGQGSFFARHHQTKLQKPASTIPVGACSAQTPPLARQMF